MKKVRVLLIILAFFIPGILFMNYIGFFNRVEIKEGSAGPFNLIYKEQTGPYKQTGAHIAEIWDFLKKKRLGPTSGFAYFIDDQKKVKQEDLRSWAGVITALPIDSSVVLPYKTRTVSTGEYIIAEYPNKNFLSVYAGTSRVYRKLKKYCEDNKLKFGPVLEIYGKDKIKYFLRRQDKFI